MSKKPHPQVVNRLKVALEVVHHQTRPEQLPEYSVVQINILNLLDAERPTRPSDIARFRGVSRGAVSHALRRLEAEKLIWREPDPKDARFVHVRLTEAGEKMKLWPAVVDEERVEAMTENLSLVQPQGLQRWLEIAGKAAAGCDFRKNGAHEGLLAGPGVWPENGPQGRLPFPEKRWGRRVRPGPKPKPRPGESGEPPRESSGYERVG